VAIESQACGTPVVAAAAGGLRTAVRDGVSGVLVDGHDPDDYAAVLGELLADDQRRRTLGRGAIAHAAGFSWAATASGMLDVYGDALADRAQRPLVVNR
jgi:D-inositol-3-phosphate glycosyltransferase